MNELVAGFNSEAKRLDLSLELSALSELEITSSDVIPSTLSPLPTVDEHEARSFNNKVKATDHSASTHPPGKVAPKRTSLASCIGNHVESVKRGVNNWVASFSNIAVRRFSPTKATIRLPPPSPEALDNSTVVIPHTVTPSRVDPPESLMSLEEDPEYQESRSLLQSWESKTSGEHSSESYDTARSQQFVTSADSPHSLENRNDVISCDIPGLTTPGVIEPGAVARLMLELKTSPPRFDDVSDISPLSSGESNTPTDPHGNSPVLSPHDTSPQGARPGINHDTTSAPLLLVGAKATGASSASYHASVSCSSTTIPYVTSTVPRTSRPALKGSETPDVDSASFLMQTADSADVASLLEKSSATADDYANYYWVGDLPPLVDQTSEILFTPSPGQVFAHYIDLIYDIVLEDASIEQQLVKHSVLNAIYAYFMKDGYALSWARLIDEDRTIRVGHLLTMSVCMWEFHGLETTGRQNQLLVTTAGVIDALQSLSDQRGLLHSMSPTSPPKILVKRFIAHVSDYVKAKENDINWRAPLATRLRLIGEHFVSGGCSHWPMMHISWWSMGQTELVDTHTKLISLRLEVAERRAADRHKALTKTKSKDVALTIHVEAPHNEISDVDSLDFSRNLNSVNTNAALSSKVTHFRATDPPVPEPQTTLRNKDELPSPPHSSPPDTTCGSTWTQPQWRLITEGILWSHLTSQRPFPQEGKITTLVGMFRSSTKRENWLR